MKPPCEVIIKEILPFIRSTLVKELVKHDIRQREVAEKLALTDAAISQYLKDSRGREPEVLEKFDFVIPEIKKIARSIAEEDLGKPEILSSICNVCREIRSSPKFCRYHREILKLAECEICEIK